MTFLPRFLHATSALLASLPAALAAAAIHIAPTGNDANPGTAIAPVLTPQAARTLVRSAIVAGLTEPVEVIFSAGNYQIDAPLILQPEDSGTAAFPITWKAAAGASVVLSGGRRITSPWINDGNGVWRTDLAGVGLGSGQWNFRQLFVNGSRATRARFPNAGLANPFLYATGGGFDHAIVNPALVKSSWGTAADAQINIVPQSRFFNQWNTVSAVNTSTGRIDITNSERHRLIDAGSWFWIEGVREELDAPGEWFLDPANGRLYYMPQPGVDPNTLEITAPYLNRIVDVKGDVNADTHVAHVHFEGLQFLHTSFTLGHIEARVHTDTVIMFENTNDSSVKNCQFENIGGYALWLHLDSQRNVFGSNTVSQSGGGGVLLTGSRLGYMDDTKIYTPGEAASKVFPILNEITRNSVEHCGRIRYYGGGVHLDSRPFSMSMDTGNHIAHNHFNDLSRNGVFAFRNQGGNVVEYNVIHNAMQTTIDGAAIHFATMNHLNAPNFILNNWLYDIWGYERKSDGTVNRKLANGVFLDWDTSNTTVRDNWIYNSVGGAVKTIWDNWSLVVSNNPSSTTAITPPFVAEVGPAGTATNGIDLANNKLTGSVIHYTQSGNFATTGTWTQAAATGLSGLFVYNFLVGTAATPSQAVYTLPIPEDGNYQISLLYKPGSDRASNVPITIQHATGTANVTWNMRQGNTHGFAVELGTWHFQAGGINKITLTSAGTDGKVIADSVAFVKVAENTAPVAGNVSITGVAALGATLTGSYTYADADNDAQGATRFQWFRNTTPELTGAEIAIPGATAQTYQVTLADRGMYLVFRVMPVAATGVAEGNPVSSSSVLIGPGARFVANLASGTPRRIVLYGTSLTANGAWVSQLQSAVQSAYPGTATWVNSGGSGQASNWGVTNLQTKVIDQNPDAVFIEFSMNDAATSLNITREQARANLTTMVNGIRAAKPQCEIILQIMNPPDRREGDTYSPRTELAKYQQDYRDFAALNNLLCIDHMPAWQALLNKGSAAFRVHVPDGVHPSADGLTLYMTPVLLHALGVPAPTSQVPTTIIDNSDSAPAMVFNGAWTNSTANTGFIGTNYVHDGNAGKGTKSAIYTPTIPSTGTYPVFLRWTSFTNRATSVPVTVNYSGGSQVIPINQRNNGGTWYKLGNFPFVAGTSGNVRVGTTGTTDGFVVVDAFGFGAVAAAPREVRLRMDNARAQESAGAGGTARKSTLTIWIPEPAVAALTIQLDSSGGTATAGSDYLALPGSITIPAGETSASVDLTPLPDALDEGDETFRISVVPHASYTLGSPVEASIVIENKVPALISEPFNGPATSLNEKPADVFSPAITSAGGSAAWMASSAFLQNGAASGGTASAYLNLGNYINNTKGTPDGKFTLTLSISAITGTWISLGFAAENTPNIQKNFTNAGSGTDSAIGVATIIYRGQNTSPAGELDMFGYSSQNAVDGPDGNTGTRTLSITIDLTPGGGHNGSNNFGTATWSDSVLGVVGSYTYTANRNFGSIFISGASTFTGMLSGLSFTQTVSTVPFDAWARANITNIDPLANASPTGDPDNDNLVNLLEFAFGMNPLVPAAGSIIYQNGSIIAPGLPVIVRDAGSFFAVFGRRVSYLADSLNYEVEFSADLAEWITADSLAPAPTPTQVAANGVIEAIRLPFPTQIPTAAGLKPPQFFRVGVKKLL